MVENVYFTWRKEGDIIKPCIRPSPNDTPESWKCQSLGLDTEANAISVSKVG